MRIKEKGTNVSSKRKEISHGGCQVNGPKVAKFLDR